MWIRQHLRASDADHGMVVVHGHSITPEPEVRGNRIGAYRSGVLTCLVLEGSELVKLNTEVVVVFGAQLVTAAHRASNTVPIVGYTDDLVALGLAATYAKPGGNVTGVSPSTSAVTLKQFETLIALVPGLRPVAWLSNPRNPIFSAPQLLIRYAEHLGNKAVFKRLGYLAATFAPAETELVAECRKRLSAGNAKLDPKLSGDRLVTAWRLLVPAGFDEAAQA